MGVANTVLALCSPLLSATTLHRRKLGSARYQRADDRLHSSASAISPASSSFCIALPLAIPPSILRGWYHVAGSSRSSHLFKSYQRNNVAHMRSHALSCSTCRPLLFHWRASTCAVSVMALVVSLSRIISIFHRRRRPNRLHHHLHTLHPHFLHALAATDRHVVQQRLVADVARVRVAGDVGGPLVSGRVCVAGANVLLLERLELLLGAEFVGLGSQFSNDLVRRRMTSLP